MKNYFKNLAILFLFTCLTFGITHATEIFSNNNSVILKQENTIVAKYNGYSEKDGYQFIIKDGTKINFQSVSKNVSDKFDLESEDFIGKTFEIVYDKNEEDKLMITELKEVK